MYEIFLIVIFAILGAVMNRVRGGWLNILADKLGLITTKNENGEPENKLIKTLGKVFNDVVYSYSVAMLFGSEGNLLHLGILYGTMLLGRSAGWGAYIKGIILKKVLGEKETEWIDELVLGGTNYPVIRNAIALSLRGLMWTASLYFGLLFISTITDRFDTPGILLFFSGLIMGPVYAIAAQLADGPGDSRHKAWAYGEHVFGGLLWGMVCAAIVL
jgi:hypothetical protein